VYVGLNSTADQKPEDNNVKVFWDTNPDNLQ
jgi:hypothetical protein